MTIVHQHFVPACYLKSFTQEKARDGTLYVLNAEESPVWRPSTPNRECIEKDFYRKGLQDKDDTHQQFESDYPNLVERTTTRRRISIDDQFRLISFMVQMYVRNPSISHAPDCDRMNLFERDFNRVMTGLADSTDAESKSGEEAIEVIKGGWMTRVLTNPTGLWMTSDNPCALYRTSRNRVTLLIMPITPKHFCVAVNLRYFRFVTTTISPWDSVRLHSATYGQRRRFGYSSTPSKTRGATQFKMDPKHRGFTSEAALISTFAQYPACPKRRNKHQLGFSFLRIIRCPC